MLDGEFGIPADGARPLLRVTAHVRTATFRWIGAEVGGYHDGENALADKLEGSFRPGMLNLADRGFFSMDRWMRFSGTGAHLAWRVKNGAKSVPFKTLGPFPTGRSWSCCTNRTACGPGAGANPEPAGGTAPGHYRPAGHLHRHPATRSGRTKTTQIRVLTTLLDHEAYPAREIAALYAERWQIERGKPDCCHKRVRLSSSGLPSVSELVLAS